MGQQGFRTLNENPYVYQEIDAGHSIAYGIDTSTNTIKIKAQTTVGAVPTGTPQIEINPIAAGNVTITPNVTGRVVIASNLTVSAGTVVFSPLSAARPCTVRSSATGQLSTLIDSNVDGQLLISSAIGTPIWAPLTSTGGTVTITTGHNTINLEVAGGAGVTSLSGDVGGPLAGALTIAGGTNIGTVAAGAAVTINLDASISAMTAVDFANGGRVGTGLVAGNTALLQAYDTLGASYTTFATLTAGNPPTMDLASAVTIGTKYIYRADGTDVPVADGGTGASTLTDHGLLIGSGVAAVDAMSAGNAGQIVTSSGAAADPVWTTATYPATVAIGDVLVASAANVIGVAAGATTAGYVLTANGAGSAPTFQASAGGGIGTLNGDSGSATGATVTIAGGTNITTSGAAATLTVNLDAALTGLTSATFATGGSIQTGTTATNTLLLQAYDVDGTAYVPFITLTAADEPTCNLASAVTIGTKYIYRADGTDVPVADGGTGASTLTANGVLYGNGTSAVGATAEGATGTILIGTTSGAPSWLAAGDANKVLTAHGAGNAVTWETPSGGGGGITWSVIDANQTAAVDNGYICNKGSALELALPTTCAVGKTVRVTGMNTALGWKITQAADQIIYFGDQATTKGAAGYLQSSAIYDSVELVCCVADLEFIVVSCMGNVTVA